VFDLPADLPADLVPLSWLIGVWEGTGVIEYDAAGRTHSGQFVHRVSFSHDGGDYLNYAAAAWLAEGGSDPAQRLVPETGYWRLHRPAGDADAGPALLPAPGSPAPRTADDVEALRTTRGGFEIEAAIVHADGVAELYLGEVAGPRIEMSTDAVVRPSGSRAYSGATRMYGLVDGHLLWAWDIQALGQELRSHASARLARAD